MGRMRFALLLLVLASASAAAQVFCEALFALRFLRVFWAVPKAGKVCRRQVDRTREGERLGARERAVLGLRRLPAR